MSDIINLQNLREHDGGKDVMALVGGGHGGTDLLKTLLKIKGYEVRYVCDVDSNAPAYQVAKENGITCINIKNNNFQQIFEDSEVTLVFEVTGNREIFRILNEQSPEHCNIVGSCGTRIMFSLLDSQQKTTNKLQEYKNTLEHKIIERTEEIENKNKELQEKVIEYEQLNSLLQAVNDQKTKYLLQATHHLKAPFAAIQSYTDLILQGFAGEVQQGTLDIVTKIRDRSILLQSSIKEMLELANLKSSVEDNIKIDSININELIQKIIKDLKAIADGKNICLNFEAFQDSNIIKGHKEQVKIMFTILIDNAINYSYDNSTIDIIINKISTNKIGINISDQGIGIPKDNINKIFDEYFRSNNAVEKHTNGTGLGLAITKEISEKNNFSISVDSTLKKGTTFSIIATTI